MNNILSAMKKRSSTRGYTAEKLTQTELESLLKEGLELGSVILGVIKDAMSGVKKDYFAEALKFPENYEFKVAIAIGHKAVEKEPHEYDMGKNISYV